MRTDQQNGAHQAERADTSQGRVHEAGHHPFEKGEHDRRRDRALQIAEAADDDDNRDIEFYLGHFEWMGFYQWKDRTLSVMLRNNLRSDNRGAVEIGWSFPISSKIKAYVKYFNGYGESLIEYNNSLQSVGFGVLISDWL